MGKSFNRWVEYAEECAELRGKMMKVAGRIANLKISGAFNKWKVGMRNRL